MLESLGKSLSKIIDERLSNPLVVSFIFAWCGWNYKFLVLLFSKTPAMVTFDLISKKLYPDWTDYVFTGIVFPLGTTLVYIYLLPYVSDRVNDYWRKKQQTDRENRQKYEDIRLLTFEESREIKNRNLELEATNEKLTDEINEATRTSKDAFKAMKEAEERAKVSEAHGQAATERYSVTKDSLDVVRDERDRNSAEVERLKATAVELRTVIEQVRHLVPPAGGIAGGMRVLGEPDDTLMLWYLMGKGVVQEPFTQAMLFMLTILEASGPVAGSRIVNLAETKLSKDLAIRSLQTLREGGYVVETRGATIGNDAVYGVSTRGKVVIETAGMYLSLFEDSQGKPKRDAETAG